MPSALTKTKAWRARRQRAYRQHLLRERLRAGERIERCVICGILVTPAGVLAHERKEHPKRETSWFALDRDGYHFEVTNHNQLVIRHRDGKVERITTKARTTKGALRRIDRWQADQGSVQMELELTG